MSGGAGYVSAILIPRLLGEGYRVAVLDLMIYGEDVLPDSLENERYFNIRRMQRIKLTKIH